MKLVLRSTGETFDCQREIGLALLAIPNSPVAEYKAPPPPPMRPDTTWKVVEGSMTGDLMILAQCARCRIKSCFQIPVDTPHAAVPDALKLLSETHVSHCGVNEKIPARVLKEYQKARERRGAKPLRDWKIAAFESAPEAEYEPGDPDEARVVSG